MNICKNLSLVAIVCAGLNLYASGSVSDESQSPMQEQKSDAEIIADYFYALNGDKDKPHKKVNHAKGFCASGEFIPDKKASKRFDIPLLENASVPTQVRFSLGGGNENQSDKSKNRSMALKIRGNGDFWEIAMTNSRINFAKNAEEFKQFMDLQLQVKNKTMSPEEADNERKKVSSFVNAAKETQNLTITRSYGNNAYHSVHTFYFKEKNKAKSIPARFSFVPKNGVKSLNQNELDSLSDDFLEANFKSDIAKSPIEFSLKLVLPNPKDDLKDTAKVWEGKHREITLGTLKVNKFDGYECNFEVFMPSILPQGIKPPNDDIFELRNVVYGITFGKRQ